MSERLTADSLRQRLGGIKSDPGPMIKMTEGPNPLPFGESDSVPAQKDLVASTFSRYASAPPRRTGFRRGGDAAALAAPPAPFAKTRRANSYGAKCILCAIWVAAGEGYLVKDAEGNWAAEHQAGECGTPDTSPEAQAVAAETEVPPGFVKIVAITGQTYVGLQPGVYTLETASGHRTFRVRVQSTEEDFAPGKTILDYLSGPDNSPRSKDWTGFAFLNGTRLAVWAKHKSSPVVADAQTFLADPSQALLAATCIRCNASLSTPESIRALMGPDCRKKGW